MANMINCPHCGKLTDPQLENCPHCGGRVRQKHRPQPAARKRGRQTCPSCKALVQEGDIICVVGGTNRLTGQKVGPETAAPSKRTVFTPQVVVGSIVTVLAIVVAGFFMWAAQSDPVARARQLIADGENMQALTELRIYVQPDSMHEEAVYELGRLEAWNGRPTDAARNFERIVLEMDRSNLDAARSAVVYLGDIGPRMRPRQIEMLRRLASADASDWNTKMMLALSQGAEGDTAGLMKGSDEVLSARPMDSLAHWSLGIGYALRGDYKAAKDRLERARRIEETAEEPALTAEVMAAKGFVASLSGDTEKALELLSEAVQNPALPVRKDALTQLGKLLIQEGRLSDALAHLEAAMLMPPVESRVPYLRALCLLGLREDARGAFEVISQQQNNPYALDAAVRLASIALSIPNLSQAQDAIDRAERLGGGTAAYFTVRGRVDASSGNLALARENFRKAIVADGTYAAAYLESGLTYLKEESLSEALRELERYLELIGDDTQGADVERVRALAEQLRQTTGQGSMLEARIGERLEAGAGGRQAGQVTL